MNISICYTSTQPVHRAWGVEKRSESHSRLWELWGPKGVFVRLPNPHREHGELKKNLRANHNSGSSGSQTEFPDVHSHQGISVSLHGHLGISDGLHSCWEVRTFPFRSCSEHHGICAELYMGQQWNVPIILLQNFLQIPFYLTC